MASATYSIGESQISVSGFSRTDPRELLAGMYLALLAEFRGLRFQINSQEVSVGNRNDGFHYFSGELAQDHKDVDLGHLLNVDSEADLYTVYGAAHTNNGLGDPLIPNGGPGSANESMPPTAPNLARVVTTAGDLETAHGSKPSDGLYRTIPEDGRRSASVQVQDGRARRAGGAPCRPGTQFRFDSVNGGRSQ